MKKKVLLLLMLWVALSSFAAPKMLNQSEPIQLNANAEFEMVQAKYENEKAIRSGKVEPMRSWQDSNGTVWNAYLINNGGLWTMLAGGTYTAEDFPAYWVSLNIYNDDRSCYYELDLAYPSNLGWFYDPNTQTYLVDECASVVGAENINNPSPLEWYDEESVFTMISEGYVSTFGILHPGTVGTTCTHNGSEGWAFDDNTTLYFAGYDSEISYLEISLKGSLTSTQTRSVSMDYAGDVTILGLVPGVEHEVEVGEVHIFDCGDIDIDNEWAYVYLEEFEPVRRYQVYFSSTDYAYINPETGLPYNDCYTSDSLPQGPGAYVNEDGEYFSFWGTFFAAEGSEKPYGKWTGPEFWKQDAAGDVITTPEAYKLILGGYNLDISQQDGTWVVCGDFYRSPAQDSANMIIGDKNVGMDFTWTDRFGEKWHAAYKGDIFFHNDPTDFLKFEMIPAIEGITYAQSINLNKSQLDLSKGESVSLTATVLPENASNKSVTWTSSNTSVARVDKNGLVTAIGVGTAIITATTTDGTNLSASCKVTVHANYLSGKTVNTYSGASERVSVEMTNEQAITAFQCDIFLPDGISVATIDGEYDINLSSRAKSSHTLSCVEQPNGAIRLLCYSMSLATFSGNEGELFDINFNISEEIKGNYQVRIDNIVLTSKLQEEFKSPATVIDFNVKAYIPGDANNDGIINVTDVLTTASYILGLDTLKFVFEAADINEDGIINVTDIVGIASIIHNGGSTNSAIQPKRQAHGSNLFIEDCSIQEGETKTIAINLTNDIAFSGFQADIKLPEGLELCQENGEYLISMSNRKGNDHVLTSAMRSDGTIRVLSYSISLNEFDGTEGALVYLTVKASENFVGDYEININNIIFTQANLTEYTLEPTVCHLTGITGIDGVNGNDVIVATIGDNIVVKNATMGGVVRVYFIDGTLIASEEVADGDVVIEAPVKGIYVVVVDGKSFKVMVK